MGYMLQEVSEETPIGSQLRVVGGRYLGRNVELLCLCGTMSAKVAFADGTQRTLRRASLVLEERKSKKKTNPASPARVARKTTHREIKTGRREATEESDDASLVGELLLAIEKLTLQVSVVLARTEE